MLTSDQLSAIEARMAEEHRKDMEALQRLKRFAVDGATESKPAAEKPKEEPGYEAPEFSDAGLVQVQFPIENGIPFPVSIISKVEEVMRADSSKLWTVPGMVAHLRKIEFPLAAQKPEATMGLVFNKLVRRGKAQIVRKGSGRTPNIYRATTQEQVVQEVEHK